MYISYFMKRRQETVVNKIYSTIEGLAKLEDELNFLKK